MLQKQTDDAELEQIHKNFLVELGQLQARQQRMIEEFSSVLHAKKLAKIRESFSHD